MPLPILVGAVAVASSVAGAVCARTGYKEIKAAKEKVKEIKSAYKRNLELYKKYQEDAEYALEKLGRRSVEIKQSFSDFADCIERIQNRPEFCWKLVANELTPIDVDTIKNESNELTKLTKSAASGMFAGLAANGLSTSSIAAFSGASTTTTVSSLGGVVSAQASLSLFSGGALTALNATMIIGGATLGVAVLLSGLAVKYAGDKMSKKSLEAAEELDKINEKLKEASKILDVIEVEVRRFREHIEGIGSKYYIRLDLLKEILRQKQDWQAFTEEEKTITINTITLARILKTLIETQVIKEATETTLPQLDEEVVHERMLSSHKEVSSKGF